MCAMRSDGVKGRSLLFGPAFSLGPKRAKGCSRGGEFCGGSVARPKLSYVSRGERCAATPVPLLQARVWRPTCPSSAKDLLSKRTSSGLGA